MSLHTFSHLPPFSNELSFDFISPSDSQGHRIVTLLFDIIRLTLGKLDIKLSGFN